MKKFLSLNWLVKILTAVAVFSTALLQLAQPVQAATLQLNSIGSSVTTGKTFSTWTYTRENPVFMGTAGPSATVTVTLNSAANTVTADAAGAWTFTPTTLLEGSHTVAIASDAETINFTLVISPTGSSSTTASDSTATGSTASDSAATDLPVTGGLSTTLFLVIAGLASIGLGLASWAGQPVYMTHAVDATEQPEDGESVS
jgi:hypothetical protein